MPGTKPCIDSSGCGTIVQCTVPTVPHKSEHEKTESVTIGHHNLDKLVPGYPGTRGYPGNRRGCTQ
eukprot:1576137-Rhodomonas_salina.1